MSDTDLVLGRDTVLGLGDVLDTYSTDDGTVVLVAGTSGHRVVRLSPLGRAVQWAVGSGLTLAELEVELVSRLGKPPTGDLSQLVRSAVLSLVDEGVIVAGQVPKGDNSGDIRS